VPLTFTIRRRTIPSRVRIVKDEHVRAAARVVHRYLCSFTTIAAEDWDAIGRYVENTPEPEAIESALSEDARSLPVHIVTKVVEQLVRLKRLNAPTGTSAPLIRLEMGPVFDLVDGRRVRDVTVVSRLRASSAIRTYHTRFRIFADDRLEVLA
jgi:anti-sigma factor ChrR (cupin superfamily)